jgi:hypothetical protein
MNKTILAHVKENPANGSLGVKLGDTYFFVGKDNPDKEKQSMYFALSNAAAFPAQHHDNMQRMVNTIFGSMDWKMLKAQKRLLLEAMNVGNKVTEKQAEALHGILHLIDAIQDAAVDDLGFTSMEVFQKNYPPVKGKGGVSEKEVFGAMIGGSEG